MILEVKIVEGDEWEALYFNGHLMTECAKIDTYILLDALQVFLRGEQSVADITYEFYYAYAYTQDNDEFPSEFSEDIIDEV